MHWWTSMVRRLPQSLFRTLTHLDRGAHTSLGVSGLDADEPVRAGAAQADLERDVLAGPHVGRDGAAVAARPEDHEVVCVLAEVVDVEAHAAARHDRAVDAEAVLAGADADGDGCGGSGDRGEGGGDHRTTARRPNAPALGMTSAASVPIQPSSSEQ